MNWKALWDSWVAFFRRAGIPLIIIAVVLVVPWVRSQLTIQLQTHPLWGAFVLAVLCFVAAYLVTRKGGQAGATATQFRDAGMILAIALGLFGFGLLFTGASTTLATEEARASALNCAMLWAAAWFMAGFLAGFLFGVPKVAGNEGTTPPAAGAGQATPGAFSFAQRPNTNLEQISDWLTKIIVGLGLVELRRAPDHLKSAATWVAESLSTIGAPNHAAVSFAGSLIVYFSILGFLAGYLLTLLFLAGAFGRAGQQAYGGAGSFGVDNLSDRIRTFWKGSPPDAQKLAQWVKGSLPEGTSITDLITTKELDEARKKVVADLRIP